MNGRVFPACRDRLFRALYIDDSIIASVVRVDRDCVRLLPTHGPHGVMESCGLGVPGKWFALEHKLRDICDNAESIGMRLNAKKTTLMIFNETKNRKFLPFCLLSDGDPLPVVSESCLLGVILDEKLSWWPLVSRVKRLH